MPKSLKTISVAVLCSPLLLMCQTSQGPTADDIVARYVEAIGGETTLGKIENRRSFGHVSAPKLDFEGTMTVVTQPPDYSSDTHITSLGWHFRDGVSDGVAWSINPPNGSRIHKGSASTGIVRRGQIAPYVHWKEHFSSAKIEGEETVGEHTCYKVVFTPERGSPESVYFDKSSGLIRQVVGTSMTTSYQAYKEFDGLMFATTTVQHGSVNGTITITFDAVEHNVEIEDGTLDLPKPIKALRNTQ